VKRVATLSIERRAKASRISRYVVDRRMNRPEIAAKRTARRMRSARENMPAPSSVSDPQYGGSR